MYLPDVNVILALVFDAHQHHPAALNWFSSVTDERCVICRLTQSSFLRLASNPVLFGKEALQLPQAWSCFDALMDDSRFEFALEPVGMEHLWRRLTISGGYSPKVWNDAYLAAFAIAGDLTLVSFDQAFRAVPDLSYILLTSDAKD